MAYRWVCFFNFLDTNNEKAIAILALTQAPDSCLAVCAHEIWREPLRGEWFAIKLRRLVYCSHVMSSVRMEKGM